jgi:hypothetical protein
MPRSEVLKKTSRRASPNRGESPRLGLVWIKAYMRQIQS